MSKFTDNLKNKDRWMDVVRAVAPTLATALGGPLAGVAVAALSESLLGQGEIGNEEQLAEIISGGDAETILKLKKAELQFKQKMEELDIRREQLIYQDKDSARKREMVVKDKMPGILGVGAVAGFIVYVGVITFFPVAIDNELLFFVLGQLSGHAGTAFAYYHGSSAGSKAKTDVLDRVVNHKP